MGNCYAGLAVAFAKKQIGKPCGKTNEYSKQLDSIDFYNTQKNGYANSCSIFVDDSVLNACTDPSVEEDIESAKWTALAALYEPQSEGANEGAGCAQAVRYFQENGAWIEDTADMERGDKIFYRRDSAVSKNNPLGVYHTGIIVDWGEFDEGEGFKVVEGNTTYEGESGMVAEKFYSFGDKRIAGAGRPNYDGWMPESDNEPEKPEEPEKPVEPETPDEGTKYTVSVNTWLNVRNGCGMEYPIVDKLYDGETVTVYEEKDGWGRISNNMDLWVCMKYLY